MRGSTLLARASALALASSIIAGPCNAATAADRDETDPVETGLVPTLPQAQETPPTEGQTEQIVVTGVRNSLAIARDKKRKSGTIVDIVEAEDIGKLPNNTVGDVVASIPGISVYRTEGEVNDIQMRGLFGVQTTLGGTPIESGADRVASIADLPADLVKSVEVYKTRTPDQPEGSGAGSINIELRKPTDFKKGLTFSGNATLRYNNQSQRYNQVYTGILNYNLDSAIGELGAQLGVTVNHNPFLESQARNDPLATVQTRQVVGPQILPSPTLAPNQVAFLYTTGSRTTPTVSGSLQWTPDDQNNFVLEGTYAKPTFDRFSNSLFPPVLIQGGSTNTLPALSNIVLVPGTNRMASVTVSPVTQMGPISDISESNDSNFLLKFSAEHKTELLDLTTEIAYTGANRDYELITTRNRFVNRPTYDVVFASPDTRFPMMNLTFRDLDLLDPNQYRFFGVIERNESYENRTLATRADLTLRTFAAPVDWFKFGVRLTRRTAGRDIGQREANNLQIKLEDMPEGYRTLAPIAEGFGGTGVENNARWLSYDRDAVRENYGELRQFIAGFSQYATLFGTENVAIDPAQHFRSTERTWSVYGMAHYNIDLLFPIDGLIGSRFSNTLVDTRSFSRRTLGSVVRLLPNRGEGNYMAIEPTVTAIVHFTPKLQMRLSYNIGIQRPSVDQITPYVNFTETTTGGSGSAGNPNLQPVKTTRYDAILEYYFGKNGLITVNPFYWKLSGSIANATTIEALDEGTEGLLYSITRPYNTGEGYRRGVEVQAQTFFTFLPGILKNFGVIANYTYVESLRTWNALPGATSAVPVSLPIERTPKHVYNLQALFERGSLNARLSYNYNGSLLDSVNTALVRESTYVVPRDWMDAAINYTIPRGPLKNIGFSLQVQNVLASARRSFYGHPDLPRDVIYMARTYGGTIRYRF